MKPPPASKLLVGGACLVVGATAAISVSSRLEKRERGPAAFFVERPKTHIVGTTPDGMIETVYCIPSLYEDGGVAPSPAPPVVPCVRCKVRSMRSLGPCIEEWKKANHK